MLINMFFCIKGMFRGNVNLSERRMSDGERIVAGTVLGGYMMSVKGYSPLVWSMKLPGKIKTVSVRGGDIYAGGIMEGIYRVGCFSVAKFVRKISNVRKIEMGDAMLVIDKNNTMYYGSERVRDVSDATISAGGVIYVKGTAIRGAFEYDESSRVLAICSSRDGGVFWATEDGMLKIKTAKGKDLSFRVNGKVSRIVSSWEGTRVGYIVQEENRMAAYVLAPESGRITELLHTERVVIRDIAISPSGDTVAVSAGSEIYVFANGRLYVLLGHWEPVNAIQFTPDGNFLVSGSSDKRLAIWDWRRGRVEREFYSLGTIHNLALTEKHIVECVSTEKEGSVLKVWDKKSGKLVSSRILVGKRLFSVAISGKRIALGTGSLVGVANHGLFVYGMPKLKQVFYREYRCRNMPALAFHENNLAVMLNSASPFIAFLDSKGNEYKRISIGEAASAMTFSPEGELIAGTFNGRVYRERDGSFQQLYSHDGVVLFVSSNGRYIISGATDRKVMIYSGSSLQMQVFQRWPVDILWQDEGPLVILSDYSIYRIFPETQKEPERYPSPEELVSPEMIDLVGMHALSSGKQITPESLENVPRWIATAASAKIANFQELLQQFHVDPLYLDELARDPPRSSDPFHIAVKRGIGPLTAAMLLKKLGRSFAGSIEEIIDSLIREFEIKKE